jgi:hypothetical protein
MKLQRLILFSLVFLAACNPVNTIPPTTVSQPSTPVSEQQVVATFTPLLSTPEPRPTAKKPPTNTSTSTPLPTSVFAPVILEEPGKLYATLFTLPVGGDSMIQYLDSGCCVNGPNAMAALPDGSFLISDMVNESRLLHYSPTGELINTIPLEELNILWVYSLQVRNSTLFLLARDFQDSFSVYELALDGQVKTVHAFSGKFAIGGGNLLEQGLTGMMVDCDGNILLEVEGGGALYRLADVQSHPDSTGLMNGFTCRGQLYHSRPSGPQDIRQFVAGETIFSTNVTEKLGGLNLLKGFGDGSFYLIRTDVLSDSVIHVDETVHYIGADRIPQGMARLPIEEFYYPDYINSSIAVSDKGDIFVLLPRQDTISVIRLNFYQQLAPFMPGAIAPQITSSTQP